MRILAFIEDEDVIEKILKLRGRTTELPRSDSNRQAIRFTRHALLTPTLS
jgi:hypothetical protein